MDRRKFPLLVFGIVVVMVSAFLVVSSANGDRDLKVQEKTEKRIEAARSDIKETLKLEKELSKYKEVVGEEVNKLDPDVAKELDELDQTVPVGSVQPFYYIGNENKSIMLLYKAEDGTNVMLKSVGNGSEWKRSETRINGNPILTIQDAQ